MKNCCLLNRDLAFSAVSACFHETARLPTFGKVLFQIQLLICKNCNCLHSFGPFSDSHLVLGANTFCSKYFFIVTYYRGPLIKNGATEDEMAQKRAFLGKIYSDLTNSSKRQIYPNLQKLSFQMFKSLWYQRT